MNEFRIDSDQAQAPSPPSPEYAATLAKVEGIIDMEPEERQRAIDAFIAERLAVFESLPTQPRINLMFNPLHKGPIKAETEISRQMIVDPLCVNDPAIYKTLFDCLIEMKNAPGWENVTLRQMLAPAINYALGKYFGNQVSQADTEQRNQIFYMDHAKPDSSHIDLSEFKGKGLAVCAEKSSAGQNLLSLLGIDSEMIMSDKCRMDGVNERAHVYNVIHTDAGYFLIDFTNSRVLQNEASGAAEEYAVSSYKIREEHYRTIMEGGTINVEHEDRIRKADGTIEKKISNRVYAGPKPVMGIPRKNYE
jgi:hypothetical protein